MSMSIVRCAAIVMSLSSIAFGQQPDTSAIHTAVRDLRANSAVMLVVAPSERVQGILVGATDTGLVVRSDSVREIAYARLTELWARKRSTGRGAARGAVVLGILGGVFLGSFAEGMCESSRCRSHAFWDSFPLGAMLGAVSGGLLGALIGSISHHWERRWPRQ